MFNNNNKKKTEKTNTYKTKQYPVELGYLNNF